MKALMLIGAIGLLVGCSSQPKAVAEKAPYCITSQTIEVRDKETVNSRTLVECTDDQIKRLVQVRTGMAPNCGEFLYWTQLGGRNVQRKGISCQKPDGNWEIINTSRYQ
jgi:hypothetical protein